jgi:hypothetical protein
MRISALRIAFLCALLIGMSGCPGYQQANVPVRECLYKGVPPRPGLGAYGYLVFTAGPAKEALPRYLKVCGSYQRSLREASEYSGHEPGTLMVTFWLLTKRTTDTACPSDCPRLIENYDYATASEIATIVKKQAASGPVLVAWNEPFDSPQTNEGLMLDLSNFADDDLDRAFGIWRDRIVRDPSVWNNGFQLVKAREAFRSLIQKYGEPIVSAVKGK